MSSTLVNIGGSNGTSSKPVHPAQRLAGCPFWDETATRACCLTRASFLCFSLFCFGFAFAVLLLGVFWATFRRFATPACRLAMNCLPASKESIGQLRKLVPDLVNLYCWCMLEECVLVASKTPTVCAGMSDWRKQTPVSKLSLIHVVPSRPKAISKDGCQAREHQSARTVWISPNVEEKLSENWFCDNKRPSLLEKSMLQTAPWQAMTS